MAERSALVVSWGLSLLSIGMISNFTPAALFLLNSSARYCQLFIWLVPNAAIRPDSGSSHAILTVSPCWAIDAPAALSNTDAATVFNTNCMLVSCVDKGLVHTHQITRQA